jgi:hypothetical protein
LVVVRILDKLQQEMRGFRVKHLREPDGIQSLSVSTILYSMSKTNHLSSARLAFPWSSWIVL